jgi:hypothetical protein
VGIISGGGGGGGPAAGTYLPVADTTGGVSVTTALVDPIGSGDAIKTLVFPTERNVLSVAQSGDTVPRIAVSSDPANTGVLLSNGTTASYASVALAGDQLSLNGMNNADVFGPVASHSYTYPQLKQLSPKFDVTSGALPTQQLVTATAAQLAAPGTTRDVEAHTPVTFNPGVATTATCAVAISPDNVTYSTLAVITKPVGTVFDGEIDDVTVRLPAGWYIKLTVANATLGLTTYY